MTGNTCWNGSDTATVNLMMGSTHFLSSARRSALDMRGVCDPEDDARGDRLITYEFCESVRSERSDYCGSVWQERHLLRLANGGNGPQH